MYLLSILALIIFSIVPMMFLMEGIGGMGRSLVYILDFPSLLVLLLILIPMLASAGLLKDFNNAFRLGAHAHVKSDIYELKRAIHAVSFAVGALWAAGIFSSVYAIIYTLFLHNKEGAAFAAYLGVAVIPLLYSSFLVILLLPLKARLAVKLEMMEASAAKTEE